MTIELSTLFDDEKQEFVSEEVTLELEHSLVALSKWESEFEKPFLGVAEKTNDEVIGYIRAMIVTPNYPVNIVDYFSHADIARVNAYIDAKMTGTTVHEPPTSSRTGEQISSELIYYWMVTYAIPWEAQYWHLNRLFTLIKVFHAKNSKPQKRTASQVAAQRRALNEQRRAALGTSG